MIKKYTMVPYWSTKFSSTLYSYFNPKKLECQIFIVKVVEGTTVLQYGKLVSPYLLQKQTKKRVYFLQKIKHVICYAAYAYQE